jgi:hypothetical protein
MQPTINLSFQPALVKDPVSRIAHYNELTTSIRVAGKREKVIYPRNLQEHVSVGRVLWMAIGAQGAHQATKGCRRWFTGASSPVLGGEDHYNATIR